MKFLYSLIFVLSACGVSQSPSTSDTNAVQSKFPSTPHETLTPGAYCKTGNTFRYKERIRYCERSVSPAAKRRIIAKYDQQLHYSISKMNRNDFKIDHLIPLSLGGSNEEANLWPQHKSIGAKTDVIESILSNLIIKAKITQKDAVAKLLTAKKQPELAEQILIDVRTMQSN